MKRKVLVVAAHPDDEVLGCGGTIAWHRKRGDDVHVAILAEGVTSRQTVRSKEQDQAALSDLAQAAARANQILGVDPAKALTFLEFPDNRMDSVDRLEVIKAVEELVIREKPSLIYTHHSGDVNVDHRRIHEAVITAARPQPGSIVEMLLFFEVPSSTEWQPAGSAPYFMPNWFTDISSLLEVKLEALRAYSSEMRQWPHARSIEALEHLARWRGASVGVEAAEAFMLGRCIQR